MGFLNNKGAHILVSLPVSLQRVDKLLHCKELFVKNKLLYNAKRVDYVCYAHQGRRGDSGVSAALRQRFCILNAIVEHKA